MEKNYNGTRRTTLRYLATVAQSLTERLVPCMPRHWQEGHQPILPTFSTHSEEAKMPLKIKVRDRETPQPGEIYRLHVTFDKQAEFLDSRTGKMCRSLDKYVVRLYPLDEGREANVPVGELRFDTFPFGSEFGIWPNPIYRVNMTGEAERGCLWVADPSVSYRNEVAKQNDRVLFAGNVVVQLSGPEQIAPGVVKIQGLNGLAIYDRRSDRLSSFARAEHVQRSVGQNGDSYSYEFVNLRDVSMADLQESPPTQLLTPAGLQQVEEVV